MPSEKVCGFGGSKHLQQKSACFAAGDVSWEQEENSFEVGGTWTLAGSCGVTADRLGRHS